MDARPVWLTREQRRALSALALEIHADVWEAAIRPIADAWDAAPADAAVNVRDTLILTVGIGGMERCIGPVLRALGMP